MPEYEHWTRPSHWEFDHPDDPLNWVQADIEQPRPLTLPELHRLYKLGFGQQAQRIAADQCTCGISQHSTNHVQGDPELGEKPCSVWLEAQQNPVRAAETPRQPWEGRRAA